MRRTARIAIRLSLGAALALAVAVGSGPTGAGPGDSTHVRPSGSYHLCRLTLEGAQPGPREGEALPLEVLAALRDRRGVYACGVTEASWPRHKHTSGKWVDMGASDLRLAGGRLVGAIRSGTYWARWPATFQLDAHVRDGRVDGRFEGRFEPRGTKGDVAGRLEGRADPDGAVWYEIEFPSLYTEHGHVRGPRLVFTSAGGEGRDGRFFSNRGTGKWGFTGRFDGASLRLEEDGRLEGKVTASVVDGDAAHGEYVFSLDGQVDTNFLSGTFDLSVSGTHWAEREFVGAVRAAEDVALPTDAVYVLTLERAAQGTSPLTVRLDVRDGRVVDGSARSGWSTDHEVTPKGARVHDGRLKGKFDVAYAASDGWPRPVTCTYTVDAGPGGGGAEDSDSLAGTFAAAYDAVTVFEGRITGTVSDEAALAERNALPPESPGWPDYTGPDSDFSVAKPETPLVTDPAAARLVWASEEPITQGREAGDASDAANIPKLRFVYGGYASPVVAAGKVFQFYMRPSGGPYDEVLAARTLAVAERPGDREFARWRWSINADDVVVAIDAASGATVWRRVFPARGINWTAGNKHATVNMTPCWAEGRLYVLGGASRVYCLDAETGDLRWESPLEPLASTLEAARAEALREKRLVSGGGGFHNFLAEAGGVIFTCVGGSRIVALDAQSGREVWHAPGSACSRWAHAGREHILAAVGNEVRCLAPRTGEVVWTLENVRPIPDSGYLAVSGDRLIVEEPPESDRRRRKDAPVTIRCYRLSDEGATPLWRNTDVRGGMHPRCPVGWYRDSVYVNSSGDKRILQIDLATGKTTASVEGRMEWRYLADGRLFALPDMGHETAGNLTVVYTAPGLEKLAEFYPPHKATVGYDLAMVFPVVAGRIFYRGSDRLYCYDLRRARTGD